MQSPIVRSFLERSERGPLGLFGLDAPSGADRHSLKRDLSDGKRILLRRPTVAEVRSIDKKKREVEVVASTSGVKRDGNAIYHSDKTWDFTNFAKNPAMLWSHDYGSAFAPPGLPIGFWKSWGIEKVKGTNALVMRGWFEEDEFPEKVWRRILSGTIRATSIGWNPLKYEELLDEDERQVGWIFTLNELYENSWVVIGADPDAGVRGMYQDLSKDELDVIANGRRAHEMSRGVAYYLDHHDAPTDLVRSLRTKSGVSLMDLQRQVTDEPIEGVRAEAAPVIAKKEEVPEAQVDPVVDPEPTPDPVIDPTPDPEPVVDPVEPDPPAQAAAAPEPETRVGKKMAGKRLGELKACRDSARSVVTVLDAMIAELEDAKKDDEEGMPEDMPDERSAVPESVVDLSEVQRGLEALIRQKEYAATLLGDLSPVVSTLDDLRASVSRTKSAARDGQ